MIKSTIKSLYKTLENDQSEKKTVNMSHSQYIYFHSNLYFVIVARTDINDDSKLRSFYYDLMKDLKPISRGNLENL